MRFTYRRLRREERELAWVWGAAVLGATVLLPIWHRLLGLAPVCLFHEITGIPCLSCGSTRAISALLRGEFTSAFAWNPLALIGVAIFAVGGIAVVVWAALNLPVPEKLPWRIPRWRLLVVSVLLLQWIYLAARGV